MVKTLVPKVMSSTIFIIDDYMAFLAFSIIWILISITLCVLFVPFKLRLYFKNTGYSFHADLNFRWFFDAFRLRLAIFDQKLNIHFFGKKVLTKKVLDNKKQEAGKKESSGKKSDWISMFSYLDLVKPCFGFIRDVFASFSFDKIYLKMNIGFDDPGLTGMFSGYFYALRGFFFSLPISAGKMVVDFRPHFQEEIYDFEGEFEVRNQVINIVAAVFQLILSRPVRRLAWKAVFR